MIVDELNKTVRFSGEDKTYRLLSAPTEDCVKTNLFKCYGYDFYFKGEEKELVAVRQEKVRVPVKKVRYIRAKIHKVNSDGREI